MMVAGAEDGTYLVWNAECERVTGYTADEIIRNPRWTELLFPNQAYWAEIAAERQKRGANYRNWEMELTCKDGHVCTIAWSNISAEFQIPGWSNWGIGVDVTERKRAEQRILLLQTVTAELSKALGPQEVANIIIHQRQTILDAQAGMLFALAAEKSQLQLIGLDGYLAEMPDHFRHLNLDAPSPLTDAIRSRTAIWLGSPDEWLTTILKVCSPKRICRRGSRCPSS
jgi:PAS domain S-box-containing protein